MNQTQRVLYILKKLLDSQVICTKNLLDLFEINIRTIERDMKLIREFLGESLIKTDRGCYRLLKNSYFSNIIQNHRDTKEFRSFFELLTLVDSNILTFLDGDELSFLQKIKKDAKAIYMIFDNPIEELNKSEFLEDLKIAIKHRQYCDIIYNEKEPRELKDIQPQKIIYAKNNWYLATMTKNYKNNGGFKRFRINFIEKLRVKSKTFHRDLEVEEHIKNFQSLFQDYKKPTYEVKIRVSKEVARYFRVKKHLISQKIVDEIDGDLILTYQINNKMELIPLIKMWIPHLTIISPQHLKDEIINEIKVFLKK
jgi:predicted DNA-binding transcriptional regulator YafY